MFNFALQKKQSEFYIRSTSQVLQLVKLLQYEQLIWTYYTDFQPYLLNQMPFLRIQLIYSRQGISLIKKFQLVQKVGQEIHIPLFFLKKLHAQNPNILFILTTTIYKSFLTSGQAIKYNTGGRIISFCYL